MITLSNVDAEKIIEHLTELEEIHREKLKGSLDKSTKAVNHVRMLVILKSKINKKLNKACPQRVQNK